MRTPLLLAAGLLALWSMVAGAQGTNEVIDDAVEFILSTQQPDGGFGGFGAGQTFDAILAIRAAGKDPAQVANAGATPADFLEAQAPAVAAESPALAAKAALAARALNLNPTDIAGTDFVAAITGAFDDATGRYAPDDFSHALAVLGLACTGNDVPDAAVTVLRDAQLEDGGWGFDGASDPDTTAVVVQALLAAGVSPDDPDVAETLGYFQGAQGDDGGWGIAGEPASNASSTAYVVQALLAAGKDPQSPQYTKGDQTPIDFLLSQQQEDGSFAGFDAAYAAIQVVPALAGRTLCNSADAAIAVGDDATGADPNGAAVESNDTSDDDSNALPWILAGAVGVVVVAGGAFGLLRMRR